MPFLQVLFSGSLIIEHCFYFFVLFVPFRANDLSEMMSDNSQKQIVHLRNCAMHPVLFTSNIVLFKGHTEMRGVRVCNLEIFYIFCFGR